ncbi:MAG: cell wall hydrolase [Rhodospirillales bacterium]|nr:cell wall hydrolase [Rhodospirillales bacterium]
MTTTERRGSCRHVLLLPLIVALACVAWAPPLAAQGAEPPARIAALEREVPLDAAGEEVIDEEVAPAFTPRARKAAPRRPATLFDTGESLEDQVRCLALNIYFEARSETHSGRKAVAAVTINRLQSRRFPKTICEVVRQGGDEALHGCQFSWWCDGRSDKPREGKAWREAVKMAEQVVRHGVKDPTRGALWYHADYVKPVWRREKVRVARIGRHIFYVDRRDRQRTIVEARR